MKIGELIEELQKRDQNEEILAYGSDGKQSSNIGIYLTGLPGGPYTPIISTDEAEYYEEDND